MVDAEKNEHCKRCVFNKYVLVLYLKTYRSDSRLSFNLKRIIPTYWWPSKWVMCRCMMGCGSKASKSGSSAPIIHKCLSWARY